MPHFVYDNTSTEKACSKCFAVKPLEDFTPQKLGKYGRTSVCRGCTRIRSRAQYVRDPQSYKNNAEKWRKKNLGKVREYQNSRRARLNELKSKPCADCGNTFPPYVMDFDHRNPTEKSFTISREFGTSWERLLEEVAKCDVVCSNCHRIRTFNQMQAQKQTRASRKAS